MFILNILFFVFSLNIFSMQKEGFFKKNSQKEKREGIIKKIFTDKNNENLRFFYKFPGYYGLTIISEDHPKAKELKVMKNDDFIKNYFYLVNYNIVFNINNFIQFMEKNKNNKILIIGYGYEGGSAFGEFIVNEVKKDKKNKLTLNDILKIKNSNLIKSNNDNIQIEDGIDGFKFLKNNENKFNVIFFENVFNLSQIKKPEAILDILKNNLKKNGRITIISNCLFNVYYNESEKQYAYTAYFNDFLFKSIKDIEEMQINNKDYKKCINLYFEKENYKLNNLSFFSDKENKKILPCEFFNKENIKELIKLTSIIRVNLTNNSIFSFSKEYDLKKLVEKYNGNLEEILNEISENPLKIIFEKFENLNDLKKFFKENKYLLFNDNAQFNVLSFNSVIDIFKKDKIDNVKNNELPKIIADSNGNNEIMK